MDFRSEPRRLFATAITLVAAGALLAGLTMYILFSSERSVRHTYQVKLAIGRIETDLAAAGRFRTAFLDSGESKFLSDYSAVRGNLREESAQLRRLTADDSVQQDLCKLLEKNIEARFAVLDDSITMRQAGQLTPELQAKLTSRIVAVAFETSSITSRMQQVEDPLLEERRAITLRLFVAILFLLFAILAVAVVLLRKQHQLLAAELVERRSAEQNAQLLSITLMRAQDEERRRFSRELHDSLGQILAGAKMVSDQLARNSSPDARVAELSAMLEDALGQTRTLSHLLYPPLLDEIGFVSAARWFIENYSKRTGIVVTFECPKELRELPKNLDLTLFRVLQEALTNVHRHSQGTKAEALLSVSRSEVCLRIRDNGVGMPPVTLRKLQTTGTGVGVGLAGMKGRVREQGGTFAIDSDSHGTTISVCFGLPPQVVTPEPQQALESEVSSAARRK
ncbi:MAG TPA: CHASE3 domain-containing protein [Methylomirabilota bacterium]|nr:CHASE3 domain-containing protein [Methylomirabilota bacterium]